MQKVDGSCESIREQGELAAEKPRQKRGRVACVTGFEWPKFFRQSGWYRESYFVPGLTAGDFFICCLTAAIKLLGGYVKND